jgi:hypothetical protein
MYQISLKEFLISRGLKLKWVSEQIGMPYVNFFLALKNDLSFPEEAAKNLEVLTCGGWKAVAYGKRNRFKMRISSECTDRVV